MSGVLIHIGYPKAGSSYLQQWFAHNPAVHYSGISIGGFKDAHDLAKFAQGTDKIPQWFVLSNEDLSAWKGDIEIVGFKGTAFDVEAYHQRLASILKSLFPQAKILVVTRGFEAMLKSLYSEYVRSGGILDFNELMAEYGQHISYLYNYNEAILTFQQFYGTENVIVLPFELLQDNPSTFTAQLETALGLEEKFAFSSEKINPSLSPETLAAIRKLSKLKFKALGIFPKSLQTKLYGIYMNWLQDAARSILIRLIAAFSKPDEIIISVAMLALFKDRAEVLKSNKLFEPYFKDYLL